MSDWTEVADVSEFATTDRKFIDLGGNLQIGLFKLGDAFHAVSAWCSHQKTSIVHGDICGTEIECPLHGARFDLKTGKNMCLPAVRPIPRYEVRVDGGKIFVKV